MIWLTLVLVSGLTACISAPKNESRSFAEKLNGSSYSKFSTIAGIPIATRAAQERKISGQVFCGEGIAQTPVNNASLDIKSGRKTLSSTSSGVDGAYVLYAPVDAKLKLTLEARSTCGTKQIQLNAADTKEATGLNVLLKN